MARIAWEYKEFVRSFGPDIPASQIVAAARAKGHRLKEPQVYRVRHEDKAKAVAANGHEKHVIKNVEAAPVITTEEQARALFTHAALCLGTLKATEIVGELHLPSFRSI